MNGPSFADPLNDQANSSIVDSGSSFIFGVSFPYLDKLIRTRAPANITCINFNEKPFVFVLDVQI